MEWIQYKNTCLNGRTVNNDLLYKLYTMDSLFFRGRSCPTKLHTAQGRTGLIFTATVSRVKYDLIILQGTNECCVKGDSGCQETVLRGTWTNNEPYFLPSALHCVQAGEFCFESLCSQLACPGAPQDQDLQCLPSTMKSPSMP